MSKHRLPIDSMINEIKQNCSKERGNTYYKQAISKSRFRGNWMKETELEGSVATERTIKQSVVNNQPGTSGKTDVPKHRRKQSANIPYKMSMPHTNIGRLWNNDNDVFRGNKGYNEDPSTDLWNKLSNMYIDNPYRNPEPAFDNQDMDEDDDEECNIGGEAEEIVSNSINKKPGTMSPKKWMVGYDRHFRSNTTKSGASSNGQFKYSEGRTRPDMSPPDEEDNFLTLECDENLYDGRVNPHYEKDDEKYVINSKITKHMPTDKFSRRHQSKEKRIPSEKVDDTLPNFGFVEDITKPKQISKTKSRSKMQKEPAKAKIVLNKSKGSSYKNPKKLKIKLGKSKKNNENKNPYPSQPQKQLSDEKEHMLVEDVSLGPEMVECAENLMSEDAMESQSNDENQFDQNLNHVEPQKAIVNNGASFLPNWLLYGNQDTSNNNSQHEMQSSDNFMFNQLQCMDDMADFDFDKPSTDSIVKNKAFLNEPYYGFEGFSPSYDQSYDQSYAHESPMKVDSVHDMKDLEEDSSKMLNHLIASEGAYMPDPNYFATWQSEISNIMRAILVDWMMEVCNEFTLKRETFHYALNYVDRFLSIHHNIRKEELQLIGVSCMFIAAKMEEVYSPRVADFAKSTDNGYDVHQIVKMEKLILRELQWKTTPPTYNMWANWYMTQWDIYVTTNEYALSNQLIQHQPDLSFKSSNESAYARFREVMQIIDLIVLDNTWLQYQPRGLVVSIMFLILGIHVGEYDIEMIVNEFVFSSNRFLNHNSLYTQVFSDFLVLSFGVQLHDLAPTIQYVSSFMGVPFNYDLPMSAQQNGDITKHYEEFLSSQTHHPLSIEYIKQRMMP